MAAEFYTNPKNREFIWRLTLGKYVADMVVAVVTVVGNTLTTTAILRFKLYKRLTNILILSLSICDLMIGIFMMITKTMWYFKFVNIIQWMTIDIVENLLIWASVTHLLAICIERYIAIVHPLRYHDLLSSKKFGMLMVFTWVVPVFLCLVNVIYSKVTNEFHDSMVIYIQMPLYFLFGFIMLFAYGRILKEVFKQAKRFSSSDQNAEGGKWKTEIRATKMLFVVIVAYFIAWAPVLLMSMLQLITPKLTLTWSFRISSSIAYVMGMNNSAVNFFIYAGQNSEFRRAYKALVCCKNKIQPDQSFSTQKTESTNA